MQYAGMFKLAMTEAMPGLEEQQMHEGNITSLTEKYLLPYYLGYSVEQMCLS